MKKRQRSTFRWLCLLLALLLLLPLTVACGDSKDPAEEKKPSGDNSQTEPSENGDKKKEDGLKGDEVTTNIVPKAEDFGGRTFTMLVRQNRYHYLYAESGETAKVNQATFKRNASLQTMYNIKIGIVQCNSAAKDFNAKMQTSAGEYDLVVPDYYYSLDTNGYLMNLASLDSEICFSDTWWYQGWNQNCTLDDKIFLCAGDATLEILENVEVFFFNKQKAADLGKDIYGLVTAGDWTLENARQISMQVAQNLDDGDDTNDFWGTTYDLHSHRAQPFALGIKLTRINENGTVSIIVEDSVNFDMCDSFRAYMESTGTRYDPGTARAGNNKNVSIFCGGKSLFFANALYLGTTLRDTISGWEYGIVPQPKYEAGKDVPYTSTTYGASPFGIPKTADDPFYCAKILNAMNYLSNDTTVYAMYEIVLKNQVATEQQSADMIDLCRENLYVDFSFIHDNVAKLVDVVHQASMPDGNMSSALEKYLESSRTGIDALVETYRELV